MCVLNTHSLLARQGVTFTLPRCAATLLLCTEPQAHRCAACGRSYALPSASVQQSVPASCYFCGVHLAVQDLLESR